MPPRRPLRHSAAAALAACCPLLALAAWLPQAQALRELPRQLFVTLPEGGPVLSLAAVQSAGGGWHLEIAAPGFTFSGLCALFPEGTPAGHAHVYKGSEKIGTAYQPLFPLGPLAPGPHRFTVSLRASDHRVLARPQRRGALSRSVTITVPPAGPGSRNGL
ncbi:hypothetical protein [Cribrihabitans pelagius]|uniref:hypothetical protein n=1 Tax=Cribrihabitans pelagius TaxID=1765746 RepID=UPI003B5B40D2